MDLKEGKKRKQEIMPVKVIKMSKTNHDTNTIIQDSFEPVNNNKETCNDGNYHTVPEDQSNNIITDESATIPITDEVRDYRDNYYEHLRTTRCPLKVEVIKSSEFITCLKNKVTLYNMTSKPRGLVLIINNVNFLTETPRLYTKPDISNLHNLFDQMGFQVVLFEDLTDEEMRLEIQKFSQRPDLCSVDSTFVIIMSHGDLSSSYETLICGTNDEYITDTKVLDYFTATSCKAMCNKPKVFVFLTCRGKLTQHASDVSETSASRHTADHSERENPLPKKTLKCTRNYSDRLIVYSTLLGHLSYTDHFTGNWYIQIFCEVLMNHAHDTELSKMLQMVDERLASICNGSNVCQTSEFTNSGFRDCYLNPGFFGDATDT